MVVALGDKAIPLPASETSLSASFIRPLIISFVDWPMSMQADLSRPGLLPAQRMGLVLDSLRRVCCRQIGPFADTSLSSVGV